MWDHEKRVLFYYRKENTDSTDAHTEKDFEQEKEKENLLMPSDWMASTSCLLSFSGMADPSALPQAVSAFQACHFIGMPECEVGLHDQSVMVWSLQSRHINLFLVSLTIVVSQCLYLCCPPFFHPLLNR